MVACPVAGTSVPLPRSRPSGSRSVRRGVRQSVVVVVVVTPGTERRVEGVTAEVQEGDEGVVLKLENDGSILSHKIRVSESVSPSISPSVRQSFIQSYP